MNTSYNFERLVELAKQYQSLLEEHIKIERANPDPSNLHNFLTAIAPVNEVLRDVEGT